MKQNFENIKISIEQVIRAHRATQDRQGRQEVQDHLDSKDLQEQVDGQVLVVSQVSGVVMASLAFQGRQDCQDQEVIRGHLDP